MVFITGSIDNLRCIVQYWFESGREHKVAVKPHGNSKTKKQPYYRTHPSAMSMIKEESENCIPKGTVSTIYTNQGGMMGATSLGELPRNRLMLAVIFVLILLFAVLRVYEIHCLCMVMEQSKLCESGDKFVRVVTACPEPMCLLANDQQLNDLTRFGTNPS